MPKALTIAGLVVAAVVLLLFGIDLVAGQPFGVEGKTMHFGALLSAVVLAYLSVSTLRELR